MTGARASLIWLAALGGGIALFALIWLAPHLHRVSEQAAALESLEEEGRELSLRVSELTAELNRQLPRVESETGVSPEELAAARASASAEQAKRLEDVRMLAETQSQLEEARLRISELQAAVEDLRSSVKRAEEENQILRESELHLKEQLERSNRVVEAMRMELKGNTDRLVKLEARNRALRDENDELQRKSREMDRLIAELEDLYRRREDLLSNVVRRYREVSDEYRNIALQLSSFDRGGSEATIDISRIQNALTLADEDLRQLRSLEARATKIKKEITQ